MSSGSWFPTRRSVPRSRLLPPPLHALDPFHAWAGPAVEAGRASAARRRPDAVIGFAMPYAGAEAAAAVARDTGLPLVLNLDDSPTCDDMHTHFSALHERWAIRLEDRLLAAAAATVFVSHRTAERVAGRQPSALAGRVSVIPYGVDDAAMDRLVGGPPDPTRFTVLYAGGMTGWYPALAEAEHATVKNRAKRLARGALAWPRIGRGRLDHRGSSPVPLGRALRQLSEERGLESGSLRLRVIGNRYPEALVDRVLAAHGVRPWVEVTGPAPRPETLRQLAAADALLLALPARGVDRPGGRVSAKTWEYLATDRPILAAVPAGENRDALEGWPGVARVDPLDGEAMATASRPGWMPGRRASRSASTGGRDAARSATTPRRPLSSIS